MVKIVDNEVLLSFKLVIQRLYYNYMPAHLAYLMLLLLLYLILAVQLIFIFLLIYALFILFL